MEFSLLVISTVKVSSNARYVIKLFISNKEFTKMSNNKPYFQPNYRTYLEYRFLSKMKYKVFPFYIGIVIYVIQMASGIIQKEVVIELNSDPNLLAIEACGDKYSSCVLNTINAIKLQKHLLYGVPLQDWTISEVCGGCLMPSKPLQTLDVIQYLHIPKCGTSINFFLHDYFENCSTSRSDPCPRWLTSVRDTQKT